MAFLSQKYNQLSVINPQPDWKTAVGKVSELYWSGLASCRADFGWHEIQPCHKSFDDKGLTWLPTHFYWIYPVGCCLPPPSTVPCCGCVVLSLIHTCSIVLSVSYFNISTSKIICAPSGSVPRPYVEIAWIGFWEAKITKTCWWRSSVH